MPRVRLSFFAEIAVHDVGGHAFDHRILALKAGYPFATSSMENFAVAHREVDHHSGAALDLVDCLGLVVSDESPRDKTCVLVREELIVRRNIGALLLERGQAKTEDLQTVRRAAIFRRT